MSLVIYSVHVLKEFIQDKTRLIIIIIIEFLGIDIQHDANKSKFTVIVLQY